MPTDLLISDYEACTCKGNNNPHLLCGGELLLEENGIKAKWVPRASERVQLVVLDGCLVRAPKRCDGVFLAEGREVTMTLVELKGTHWEDGEEQILATSALPQIVEMQNRCRALASGRRFRMKKVLVTSAQVSRPNLYRLFKEEKIDVRTMRKGVSKPLEIQSLWN
jgi:hypothetical protein